MRVILARIGRLALLAAQGPGAWQGIGLYALVLSLQFAGVWVTVQMINWQKTFYDALEQFDAAAALVQIGVFGWLTALSAGSWLAGQWLRKHLLIAWREKLTGQALDLWVNGKAYWYLRPGLSPTPLENPDQRIAEDCAKFIDDFLEFTLELISRVVSLVTYLSVLWGLSHFPLALTLWGVDISIPRYMVWAAFLYVFLSSILTHVLGKPLKNLSFAQERREADFRHALVQIRDQADQIAQAGGEAAELRRTGARFEALKQNWKRLITRELVLGLFVRPYRQSVLRIPTFLALPAYFGGAVTLGGLMQLASAFSNVATTLSWFIFSYRRLAGFVAVSERLDGLFAAAGNPAPLPDAPSTLERRTATDGILRARGVQLYTPQGRALEGVPDFTLSPGETLWLSGASGRGKSTFLSALRGVWPFGTGVLELPDDRAHLVDNRPMPNINVQQLVSLALVDGGLTFEAAHDYARMNDPVLMDLRSRFKLVHSPELTIAEPARQAKLTLNLRDGRTLFHHTVAVRGTPANPMERADVVAKSLDLIAPIVGSDPAQAFIDRILEIERLDTMLALRPHLQF